jgi:hypothetical protein
LFKDKLLKAVISGAVLYSVLRVGVLLLAGLIILAAFLSSDFSTLPPGEKTLATALAIRKEDVPEGWQEIDWEARGQPEGAERYSYYFSGQVEGLPSVNVSELVMVWPDEETARREYEEQLD